MINLAREAWRPLFLREPVAQRGWSLVTRGLRAYLLQVAEDDGRLLKSCGDPTELARSLGVHGAEAELVEDFARAQVQGFVQRLLEEEIEGLLGRGKSERLEPGAERVYRNGYGKPRKLALSNGTITVRRPRVRGLEERFESRVLPLFKRRTEQVGELLPQLYLHGLALGDFELALRGLLGDAAPLSSASIARLKAQWQLEFQAWQKRSLADLDIVYCWADGLYVKAGIDDGKAALLVIIGATREGEKVVVAVESGQRESRESWLGVLRDLKARGLNVPRLWVADGHLGIWAALPEIWPQCEEQRCWNHKMVNVLDQVPKKQQAAVRQHLRGMMYAESKAECEKARDRCDHERAQDDLVVEPRRGLARRRFGADPLCTREHGGEVGRFDVRDIGLGALDRGIGEVVHLRGHGSPPSSIHPRAVSSSRRRARALVTRTCRFVVLTSSWRAASAASMA